MCDHTGIQLLSVILTPPGIRCYRVFRCRPLMGFRRSIRRQISNTDIEPNTTSATLTATADRSTEGAETLTFTVNLSSGYTVVVGSTEATIQIDDTSPTNRAPPAPTLTDQGVTVGQPFTYQFDPVTDPNAAVDGDAVTYAAQLPGGSALPD